MMYNEYDSEARKHVAELHMAESANRQFELQSRIRDHELEAYERSRNRTIVTRKYR